MRYRQHRQRVCCVPKKLARRPTDWPSPPLIDPFTEDGAGGRAAGLLGRRPHPDPGSPFAPHDVSALLTAPSDFNTASIPARCPNGRSDRPRAETPLRLGERRAASAPKLKDRAESASATFAHLCPCRNPGFHRRRRHYGMGALRQVPIARHSKSGSRSGDRGGDPADCRRVRVGGGGRPRTDCSGNNCTALARSATHRCIANRKDSTRAGRFAENGRATRRDGARYRWLAANRGAACRRSEANGARHRRTAGSRAGK